MTDDSDWGDATLRKRLTYYPDTGKIYRDDGREVFTSRDRYARGRLGHRSLLAHRVAWFLHYGFWPEHEIDHIDGDGLNNRIENLRDVTSVINCRNKAVAKRSATGITGIYRTKRPACWMPQVSVGNKSISLGATPCLGIAIKRRKQKEKELGFHENHGRPSNGK